MTAFVGGGRSLAAGGLGEVGAGVAVIRTADSQSPIKQSVSHIRTIKSTYEYYSASYDNWNSSCGLKGWGTSLYASAELETVPTIPQAGYVLFCSIHQGGELGRVPLITSLTQNHRGEKEEEADRAFSLHHHGRHGE